MVVFNVVEEEDQSGREEEGITKGGRQVMRDEKRCRSCRFRFHCNYKVT
jgi:hypothetical protein